ncbi:hypothetical protein Taro_051517 [Colocasia esculenta]|uniref:Uncharacterized protein n=1 Tax=Colocasia esculenta TaxID=4460 RepID=A0A843XHI6_COLES|nr:hypothetical protein [Colocasia esculenta]
MKYLLPIDGHVEQVLHDDGDVQSMFDLHKCQGTSFINLHIHVVDSRFLSTHASRQSGDPPQLVMRGNSICTTTDSMTSLHKQRAIADGIDKLRDHTRI